MNSFETYRPTVAKFLEGRTLATGMDVARAIGRESYASVTIADWRGIAWLMSQLGWKSRRREGVKVWTRAEPQSQLAL